MPLEQYQFACKAEYQFVFVICLMFVDLFDVHYFYEQQFFGNKRVLLRNILQALGYLFN